MDEHQEQYILRLVNEVMGLQGPAAVIVVEERVGYPPLGFYISPPRNRDPPIKVVSSYNDI